MDELINIITVITTLIAPLTLLMVNKYACDAEEYYGISENNFSMIEMNNKKYFILTIVWLATNLIMLNLASNEEFSIESNKIIIFIPYIIFILLQLIAMLIILNQLGEMCKFIIIFISLVIISIILYKCIFYQTLKIIKYSIIALISCLFIENLLILLLGNFLKPKIKKEYEILDLKDDNNNHTETCLVKISEKEGNFVVIDGIICKDNKILKFKKGSYKLVEPTDITITYKKFKYVVPLNQEELDKIK